MSLAKDNEKPVGCPMLWRLTVAPLTRTRASTDEPMGAAQATSPWSFTAAICSSQTGKTAPRSSDDQVCACAATGRRRDTTAVVSAFFQKPRWPALFCFACDIRNTLFWQPKSFPYLHTQIQATACA